MRSNVLVLGIGLFIADSALAGPCKPRTSKELTVTSTATAETATTVLQTSTAVLSEISTTVSTDVTSATTVAVETALTTSEAETSTAIDSRITADTTATTDTTVVADTTTVADTTVPETTTTAVIPVATYSFVVRGSPIDGATPQGNDEKGSTLTFTPDFYESRDRTYVIEPSTGRLQDTDTGTYVCVNHRATSTTSTPDLVANCGPDDQIGNDSFYDFMTCEVANGFLSCTAPRATCEFDIDLGDEVCTSGPGVIDQFYYQRRPAGANVWFIGSADIDAGYTSIALAATKI
ncbi:hypothetical protein NW768_002596 [Fusarium equiseti]|uniref:Ig-like domain-containing protein n=1 Tax=Fusarium equiseti TaxID=61235 RepID=A0ABQ8RNV1_FUSEQ|nr:hypothetical protein NW768_002596 [Fusarium equiseti]